MVLKDRRVPVEGVIKLSYRGMKKFFRSDLAQLASRASRILRLVEFIKTSSSSPLTLKIVMGVIGKNTIGHSRSIQNLFKDFLGIECLGCREAITRLSMGIPFSEVSSSARIVLRGSEWLNVLTVLEGLLRGILKNAGVLEVDESYIDSLAERDYSALAGNPLKAFSILRGFYAASHKILPMYNPYAFFIQSLRAVPKFVIERLVGNEIMKSMRTFNIEVKELLPCVDDEYSLVSHTPGSVGDMLSSVIDSVYKLHELGAPHSSRYLKVSDEMTRYLSFAISVTDSVAKLLAIEKEFDLVSTLLLNRGRTIRDYGDFKMVKLRVRTEKPAERVVAGEKKLDAVTFLKGLSPYLVLGLGKPEEFRESESIVEFDLMAYVKSR
ncbi:MAG: hypothetical protein QXZ60_01195 [Sulfolobales archaeon]